MGWWRQGKDGSSLHYEETGLAWGDSVADIMDEAVDKVFKRLVRTRGQERAEKEIEGLLEPRFSRRSPQEAPLIWVHKIMSRAEDEITQEFRREWGRGPKRSELLGGLRFSLGAVLPEIEDPELEEAGGRTL